MGNVPWHQEELCFDAGQRAPAENDTLGAVAVSLAGCQRIRPSIRPAGDVTTACRHEQLIEPVTEERETTSVDGGLLASTPVGLPIPGWTATSAGR